MGLLSRHLRIPRPTRFLGVMSLSTGVEMISIFMIFNKLTGFYGLLAILTGFHLSSLQLTMYIYSCLAIVILAYLIPHIRKRSPFQCMLLAYFYLIDTVVNTLFTSGFAINWFLSLSNGSNISRTAAGSDSGAKTYLSKSQTNNFTGDEGITSPTHDVPTIHKAVVYGVASVTTSAGARFEETVPSFALVVALTIIRVYFIFVVLAFARHVLRQNAFQTNSSKLHLHTDGCTDTMSRDNPFSIDNPEVSGWKGKLGRIMITIGEQYWIGEPKTDDAWAKGLDRRFRTSKTGTQPPGTIERERRARSGTGPSTPTIKP